MHFDTAPSGGPPGHKWSLRTRAQVGEQGQWVLEPFCAVIVVIWLNGVAAGTARFSPTALLHLIHRRLGHVPWSVCRSIGPIATGKFKMSCAHGETHVGPPHRPHDWLLAGYFIHHYGLQVAKLLPLVAVSKCASRPKRPLLRTDASRHPQKASWSAPLGAYEQPPPAISRRHYVAVRGTTRHAARHGSGVDVSKCASRSKRPLLGATRRGTPKKRS